MLAFTLIGAADRCIGCKFGPGKAFEEGFKTMGSLALAMVGISTVAPLMSKYLAPLLTPVCDAVGIDPSMIGGIFIANDCGGWPLALGLAKDGLIGKFAGSLVGSTMGCAFVFTIPVGFSVTSPLRREALAKGLLIGLVSVPFGCFFGGLFMGIGVWKLLTNLFPLIIIAALLVCGLLFFEKVTIRCITIFGYILTAFITVALAVAIVVKQTGIKVDDLVPFDESLSVIGGIAIFLTGALTMLFFVRKLFGKALAKAGGLISVNEASVTGLLICAVNSFPMFPMLKDMDERGAVINSAFAVSGAFVFGDHLAFTASTDISLVAPLLICKLSGGIFAVLIAVFVTGRKKTPEIRR